MKKGVLLIIVFILIFVSLISFVYARNEADLEKAKNVLQNNQQLQAASRQVIDLNKEKIILAYSQKPKDYEKAIKKLGGEIIYDYKNFNVVAVLIDKNKKSEFEKLKNIVKIYRDHKLHLLLHESVPQINADDVQAMGINGEGARVAVLDTGADIDHPALIGRFNSGDSSQCYHFLGQGANYGLGCNDDHYHGTHTAGIIASNDAYYKGVAPGTSLMIGKVLDANSFGWDSDIAAAIDWAVSNGADVVSMSLGGSIAPSDPNCNTGLPCSTLPSPYNEYECLCSCYDTVVSYASDAAYNNRTLVVAASGNDGTQNVNAPACAAGAIAVGAVDKFNNLASFSTGGSEIELVAPGVSIWSSVTGGGFANLDGTSMSTPHVAGVAALMIEANLDLNVSQIRQALRDNALDLGAAGWDSNYGYGRVDALASVNAVFVPAPKIKNFTIYDDAGYSKQESFFDLNEIVYVETIVKNAKEQAITNANVKADFYSSYGLEGSVVLSHVSNGVYRGSFNSAGKNLGLYDVKLNASNSFGSATEEKKIHFYSGSGISGYELDSYYLENRHLIAGFDKGNQINAPLNYLRQKDSNVIYNFLTSSDASATNRGGISGSVMPLNFVNGSLGEGLLNGFVNYNVLALGGVFWNPDLNYTEKSCPECSGCSEYNPLGDCNSYCSIDETIEDIIINGTVFQPGETIHVVVEVEVDPIWCGAEFMMLAYNDGDGWTIIDCGLPDDLKCSLGNFQEEFNLTLSNNPGTHWIRAAIGFGGDCGSGCMSSSFKWENDDINITIASQVIDVKKAANLSLEIKDEDADYIIYNLNNFNSSNFPDAFYSDVAGKFDNVNDDRYHAGDGSDGLVSSIVSGWFSFFGLDKNQSYVAIYDNDSSDNVQNNVLAWIDFSMTPFVILNSVGAYYQTGLEGTRIKYNTPNVAEPDGGKYILAFTKGDWQTIEDDMENISLGNLPEPNFMGKQCESGEQGLCPKQTGVCLGSTRICVNNIWPECDYSGISRYEASETSCDGRDNDCDGIIDENCVIVDSDGDGVINVWDDCPGTPPGSFVNNRGCPGGGCGGLTGDVNNDCAVDILDLSTVGFNFGNVC